MKKFFEDNCFFVASSLKEVSSFKEERKEVGSIIKLSQKTIVSSYEEKDDTRVTHQLLLLESLFLSKYRISLKRGDVQGVNTHERPEKTTKQLLSLALQEAGLFV